MAGLYTRQAIHTRADNKPPRRGTTKGEAADEHQARIKQLSQDANYIIVYTDGSMKEKDGENRTRAGCVIYWKGMERKSGSEGMGRRAEVYDADMLGLLRGLETA